MFCIFIIKRLAYFFNIFFKKINKNFIKYFYGKQKYFIVYHISKHNFCFIFVLVNIGLLC